MVSLEEGGAVTAKIIDLGLAKAVSEPGSQTTISRPGVFAGTPQFASPEQLAGADVDIRSDLYSLGVTLWEMLMGRRHSGALPLMRCISISASPCFRTTRRGPTAARRSA